ncbi:hypothetical protein RR48_03195 [Papilio machaon]|uniref:Chitin-binding type-2 domain-containing protein n=1 Tax=Papilio machaon TaxID=76193 RepID=A0A0N0PDC3_PAPMA|nr:hypothetical protein RR48_03195 [Papilio machaon]
MCEFPGENDFDAARHPSPSVSRYVDCGDSFNHTKWKSISLPTPLGYRPHETDCAKFYQCSNGHDFEMTCGPGTVFDENLQVCNWPYAVDCKKKTSPKKPAKSQPPKKDSNPPSKASPAKGAKKPATSKAAAKKPAKA